MDIIHPTQFRSLDLEKTRKESENISGRILFQFHFYENENYWIP